MKGWEHYQPKRIVGGTITRGVIPDDHVVTARPTALPHSDQPKLPKFGNRKRVTSDGVLCDSEKEARHWETLLLRARAGEITDLLPHPSFPLYVGTDKIGRITFDAMYVEGGRVHVIDVKSRVTAGSRAFTQRWKTFLARYPHIDAIVVI